MANKKVLAFDIGGTKLASAVVEIGKGKEYNVYDYEKAATPADGKEIVAKILSAAAAYRQKHRFNKIGIAVAGQVSPSGDKVVHAPNILQLDGLKLKEMVSKKTGFEVVLINDVRAFALGEDRFGKFSGAQDALFLAIGTGIGGAVKIGGKFRFGNDNIAGEFGHMVIEKDGMSCACGRKGCWERYVGGPGLEAMYVREYGEKKDAKDILQDGARGKENDVKVLAIASSYLSAGIANLVNVFDPEIVIVGGSMMKGGKLLRMSIPAIRQEVLPSARKVKIAASSLGDDAFLLGAAIA